MHRHRNVMQSRRSWLGSRGPAIYRCLTRSWALTRWSGVLFLRAVASWPAGRISYRKGWDYIRNVPNVPIIPITCCMGWTFHWLTPPTCFWVFFEKCECLVNPVFKLCMTKSPIKPFCRRPCLINTLHSQLGTFDSVLVETSKEDNLSWALKVHCVWIGLQTCYCQYVGCSV